MRPKPTSPTTTVVAAASDGGGGSDDGAVFQQPYVAQAAQLSSTQALHADRIPGGSQNPAGHNCVGECHSVGLDAGGKPFAAAGTVYTDNTGNTAVGPGVEVRIRNANGTAQSAFTDENGNWFIRVGQFDIQQNAIPGIRDAVNGPMLMASYLGPGAAGGACAAGTCHVKGAPGGVLRVRGP